MKKKRAIVAIASATIGQTAMSVIGASANTQAFNQSVGCFPSSGFPAHADTVYGTGDHSHTMTYSTGLTKPYYVLASAITANKTVWPATSSYRVTDSFNFVNHNGFVTGSGTGGSSIYCRA